MNKLKILVTACQPFVLALMIGSGTIAQEAPVKKAPSIAFDINGEALRKHSLFKFVRLPTNNRVFQFVNAKRFFGALSLPDNFGDLATFGPGNSLPLDILIVGEFLDKQERSKMLGDDLVETMGHTTLRGKEYRTDPTLPNAYLLVEDSRFEFGTSDYLTSNRSSLLGNSLKQTMNEFSQAPAKLAIDVDSQRAFYLSAIDVIKLQGVPATFGPFLELPKKMDLLQVIIEPQASELLRLVVTSKTAEDTAFVSKSIQALLGLAKLGLDGAPKDQVTPRIIASVLAGAEVSTNAGKTILSLPKPPGFDSDLVKAFEEFERTANRMQRINDFKQTLLAMHNYHEAYRQLPFRHEAEGRFSPELSWRVRVLPFIEQSELYQKFALDKPWDSDANRALAMDCPAVFGANGKTSICWIKSEVESFVDITDGTSNTICLMENPGLVDWTSPTDLTIEQAEKLVKELPAGRSILIGRYDGSVISIDNTINMETLRGMLTPNGGEVVGRIR